MWDRWTDRVAAPDDEEPEPWTGRMRGQPAAEREPTKRDRIAEKLRDLDEPYLRRERSLTRD